MVKKKTLFILAMAAGVFIFLVAILTIPFNVSAPHQKKVAVIQMYGTISSSSSLIPTEQNTNPNAIIELLEKAEKDDSIKAIVLEINSGGGSPVACDEIAAKIKSINKTTVAWIGDIGASGAYWIASSADKVTAHSLSLTCSIGAYSVLADWTELFNKTGMNFTVVKSGEHKTIGNYFDPLSDEGKEIFQEIVDAVNEEFIQKVSENRGLTYSFVETIADGRPCLGKQALEYGLVDELGNKQDAIELAKEQAGVEEAEVIVLKQETSILKGLFGTKLQDAFYALGSGIGKQLRETERSGSVLT